MLKCYQWVIIMLFYRLNCLFLHRIKLIMEIYRYKYITIIGLVSVLVLQTIWIHNSYALITNDIKNKCNETLKDMMFREAMNRPHLKYTSFDVPSSYSGAPDLTFVEDILYKKIGSNVSLLSLNSLMHKALLSKNINSDYVIYNIDCKTNKIIGVSKKEDLSLFTIKSKIFHTRTNKSQGLQLVLNNPYYTLFERLGLLMIASFIISVIIVFCILQQIRIIIRQNNIAKIRKDFSYAMVHDMKSPLTSIMVGVSNLQTGLLDNKPDVKNKYLSIMGDESRHLLSLINKVLTISKIEENKLTLNKTDVAIRPMVQDVADKYSAKQIKPINFTSEIKAASAYADEEYLKEAIVNFVDNAVKYSNDSVDIHFSSTETSSETLISVRDNGIGISDKDKAKIFDKFERASATGRTMLGGASGFGLGLNYVMLVMDAHGGRVSVDSVKGEYSEFTLYIPKKTKN